jgi:nucleoside-diphosphate-sugar epimerase
MSRVLVTVGPGLIDNHIILRLLDTAREVRITVLSARVTFTRAVRHDDAEALDAAAGCEFVDDRIRLRE